MLNSEDKEYDSMVYDKLRKAELQAESTTVRLGHGAVMDKARELISKAEGNKVIKK